MLTLKGDRVKALLIGIMLIFSVGLGCSDDNSGPKECFYVDDHEAEANCWWEWCGDDTKCLEVVCDQPQKHICI